MTVMVAEQAGKTAAKSAGRKVTQGKVTSSTYDTYNTRQRSRPRPAAQPVSGQQRPRVSDIATPAASYAGARRQAQQFGRNIAIPGDRAYQPVILAEFLAAALIIALPPIITGGSETARAKGGMSPYDTGDLRQLVAAGGVYFVLALASSGNSGRLSAWLGGLVLIAIAMGKLANGGVSAVFNFAKPGQGAGTAAAKEADPFAQGNAG